MRIGLFEDEGWRNLLPLTRLRAVWDIWWGMDTLAHKWSRYYGWDVVGYGVARAYLQQKYPFTPPAGPILWLNARLLPFTPDLPQLLSEVAPETLYLSADGVPVAILSARLPSLWEADRPLQECFPVTSLPSDLRLDWLTNVTDLFQRTEEILTADWAHLQERSVSLPSHVQVRGRENVFLHPTARVGFACIDAEKGPVWIGPHAEIQDGVLLQHTNAVGPHTTLVLGAKIRTHNSFGPFCKVGGEVGQTTLLGYSNKAHDGFMGHSVLGEWCNIGAGSNTSNLKNTYGSVRLYHIATGALRDTGLQFCGLIMGDYARCGIQTPFTTGCVVDIFANVVSAQFTPKYIPPFYWAEGELWKLPALLETARRMRARRGLFLSSVEETLLTHLWEETSRVSPS